MRHGLSLVMRSNGSINPIKFDINKVDGDSGREHFVPNDIAQLADTLVQMKANLGNR